MKPIKDVYPTIDDECPSFCDYSPLLTSFGYEILLKVDDTGYQGDSRLLFKDGERIGLLIFGWGSCSGCDTLKACDTLQEVDKLRTDLHNEIKWFGSKAEALEYFTKHDWEGDYSWHHGEMREFIIKATSLLAS